MKISRYRWYNESLKVRRSRFKAWLNYSLILPLDLWECHIAFWLSHLRHSVVTEVEFSAQGLKMFKISNALSWASLSLSIKKTKLVFYASETLIMYVKNKEFNLSNTYDMLIIFFRGLTFTMYSKLCLPE